MVFVPNYQGKKKCSMEAGLILGTESIIKKKEKKYTEFRLGDSN